MQTFAWVDDEVVVLIQVTPKDKASHFIENIDWESRQCKLYLE